MILIDLQQSMNISSQSLHFTREQVQKELCLENNTSAAFIFKLKITRPNFFFIKPSKGVVKPSQKQIVYIQMRQLFQQQVKLQVSYAQVHDSTSQTPEQLWKNVHKEAIVDEYVMIKCLNNTANSTCENNGFRFKQTDSPIIGIEEYKSQGQIKMQASKLQNSSNFQSIGSSNMIKTFSNIIDNTGGLLSSKTTKVKELETELQRERQLNKQLQKTVKNDRQKLEYYRSVAQTNINRNMGSQQEGCLNFFNLIMIVFICLFLGYFMAKYSSKGENL